MPRSSTSNGAIAYTDSQRLGSPLLEDSAPPLRRLPSAPSSRSASGAKALRRFRKVIVAQMARMRAERAANVNPPALSAAREYMRYYLPKTSDGKLLSLRCSEAEFTSHVGSGVSIYMHFVKMTGWLFVLATLIAIPQFIANAGGHGLHLNWPWGSKDCDTALAGKSGIMRLVAQVMSTLGWLFFSAMLGNATFTAQVAKT